MAAELLQDIVQKPFARLTYTDAVELLLKAKVRFEFPVKWGSDLQSEHERYLTEKEFDGTPLFVTDYPKDIKVLHLLNAILSSVLVPVCITLLLSCQVSLYLCASPYYWHCKCLLNKALVL